MIVGKEKKQGKSNLKNEERKEGVYRVLLLSKSR